MAQAVMAQAFARASTLTGDTTLENAAVAIFHAVQLGLVRQLAQGPWIRLYSFDRGVVLNAQLQAILSLEDYAAETADASASTLAAALPVRAGAGDRLPAPGRQLQGRRADPLLALEALAGDGDRRRPHDERLALARLAHARLVAGLTRARLV